MGHSYLSIPSNASLVSLIFFLVGIPVRASWFLHLFFFYTILYILIKSVFC